MHHEQYPHCTAQEWCRATPGHLYTGVGSNTGHLSELRGRYRKKKKEKNGTKGLVVAKITPISTTRRPDARRHSSDLGAMRTRKDNFDWDALPEGR